MIVWDYVSHYSIFTLSRNGHLQYLVQETRQPCSTAVQVSVSSWMRSKTEKGSLSDPLAPCSVNRKDKHICYISLGTIRFQLWKWKLQEIEVKPALRLRITCYRNGADGFLLGKTVRFIDCYFCASLGLESNSLTICYSGHKRKINKTSVWRDLSLPLDSNTIIM